MNREVVARELVLQGIFWHLVKHQGLKLGIRDLNEALTALNSGYGLYSRDELLWLCQTLWARNQEEERIMGLLFRQFPTPTRDEIDRVFPQGMLKQGDESIQEKALPTSSPESRQKPAQEKGKEDLDFSLNVSFVGSTAEGLGLPRANISPDPSETFILSQHDTIHIRTLIIIWRRFRKSLRTGPKVEIDVDATIKQKCNIVFLTSPVLIPARRNQARLTILIDVMGSMLPWQRFNPIILESLHQSQLEHVAVYYFQNVPEDSLYTKELLTRPLLLSTVKQMSPNTGLLIISDAGAARGNCSDERLRKTKDFLNTVADVWHPVAWINPMPKSRWRRTTAEAISQLPNLVMFELDEGGMTNAVDFLRGYRNF